MRHESISYSCEKCGKKIPDENSLDIVTSLNEGTAWSRLHVEILHVHGVHNDSETEKAELCKSCTIELLKDALKRIFAGERATAGTEDSKQKGWDA